MMTDFELTKAFEEKGYSVTRIKRWRDGQIDVIITRGSQKRLEEASKFGRTIGVIVCQPC